MQFRVPPKKVVKMIGNLDSMISSGSATFRELARVAGSINSLCLAVGPIARLLTRQMHATIQARSRWDCSFSLSSPLSEELRFWSTNIGYGIQPKLTPGAVIFCDASDYAFRGYRVKSNDQPVSGMFSRFECQQSYTCRELKAIFYVIKAHVASLRRTKVKVFTDNENASRIVSVGSPKQHLHCLALDIFQLCLVNDIQIDAQWIPRDANVRADLLSRFVDKDFKL